MEEPKNGLQTKPNSTSEIKKPDSFKLIPIVFIVVIGLIGFWVVSSQKKRSSQKESAILLTGSPESLKNAVTLDFIVPTGTIPLQKESSIDVIIKGVSSEKKISAVQLIFTAQGSAEFLGIELSRPDGGHIATLQQMTEGKRASITGVILDKASNLPDTIKVRLRVSGNQAGTSALRIDSINSKVVGPVKNTIYQLLQKDNSTITFQ